MNKITLSADFAGICPAGKGRFFLWGLSFLCLSAGLVLQSCVPNLDAGKLPFSVDLIPPILQSAEITDSYTVVFRFDDAVFPVEDAPVLTPFLPVAQTRCEGRQFLVELAAPQSIGQKYTLRAGVQDAKGNMLEFLFEFYGWNPRVPSLLINELNPRGSGKNPDCVEILVLSDGNLGGILMTVGTEEHASGKIILPAVEVLKDDFLLLHAKSQGLPEEIDELGSVSESGGLLASDTARDFWIPDSPGLPGNNGAVSLYQRNGGLLMDAVLWSDRVFDDQDDKLGWTSAGYQMASDLAASDGWESSETEIPSPSDAVDVSFSTATRSLCRASVPLDTDTREDWHTVPTKGSSFGTPNSDEVYVP